MVQLPHCGFNIASQQNYAAHNPRKIKAFSFSETAKNQCGFISGNGTRKQILYVRQIVEKAREFKRPVVPRVLQIIIIRRLLTRSNSVIFENSSMVRTSPASY